MFARGQAVRLGLTAAITVVGLTFAAATAEAQTGSATATFTVTANVKSSCTIGATNVAFGDYDPLVANASAALTANGSVTITCTKGTAATIGLSGTLGARTMGGTPSGSLAYELYRDSGFTLAWGGVAANWLAPAAAPSKAARTFTVYGRIAGGLDPDVASYSDTVTATVNF
jgi:spore coat protein U domain-containing protein, fimbrial subunit CupE1/2/3/6